MFFFSMYVVANRESKALLTLILKYESAGEWITIVKSQMQIPKLLIEFVTF